MRAISLSCIGGPPQKPGIRVCAHTECRQWRPRSPRLRESITGIAGAWPALHRTPSAWPTDWRPPNPMQEKMRISMVTKDNAPIAAAAADATTPLTPEQVVEQLRILRQHVPDFGPLPVPSAKALRTTAQVPGDFVLASINTIGASPAIAQALASDAPALLAQREDADRWS